MLAGARVTLAGLAALLCVGRHLVLNRGSAQAWLILIYSGMLAGASGPLVVCATQHERIV